MKIFLFAILSIFLAVTWMSDFVKLCHSFDTKDYGWRMADFCLTSILCVAIVVLSGMWCA